MPVCDHLQGADLAGSDEFEREPGRIATVTNPSFGLIGTGFMGKAHAIALRAVGTVFAETGTPHLTRLVDTDRERASRLAAEWGFDAGTDDWKNVCDCSDIDVIDICTPNHLHRAMALAAIAGGKHVYCEKPLALTADEARTVANAAQEAGVHTALGFNYICNPLIGLAREIVSSGELGEIFQFRGAYLEDYLADADIPLNWRCLRDQAGHGALADLGTHLINMAEYLLGPIASVFGSLSTEHLQRKDPASGELRDVENEDTAQALLKFERGCPGSFETSRIAVGRKCGLTIEIYGSKGTLSFDQERMNEIKLFRTDPRKGQQGFRTILAGPEHADYAAFCPAPGHGLGINDLKIIEVRNLLRSIASDTPVYCDFENGYRVQQVADAIVQSHTEHSWVDTTTRH